MRRVKNIKDLKKAIERELINLDKKDKGFICIKLDGNKIKSYFEVDLDEYPGIRLNIIDHWYSSSPFGELIERMKEALFNYFVYEKIQDFLKECLKNSIKIRLPKKIKDLNDLINKMYYTFKLNKKTITKIQKYFENKFNCEFDKRELETIIKEIITDIELDNKIDNMIFEYYYNEGNDFKYNNEIKDELKEYIESNILYNLINKFIKEIDLYPIFSENIYYVLKKFGFKKDNFFYYFDSEIYPTEEFEHFLYNIDFSYKNIYSKDLEIDEIKIKIINKKYYIYRYLKIGQKNFYYRIFKKRKKLDEL